MTHPILKGCALTLVAPIVFGAAPAAAQFGPPPADFPDMVNHNPVFNADLGSRGSAAFAGVLDPATGRLCYMINVPGLDQVTMAHIHKGAAGENGAPVVPLTAPTGGSSNGCATLAPDLVKAIVANPGGYYVNVHTAAFPGGATRGQLERTPGLDDRPG